MVSLQALNRDLDRLYEPETFDDFCPNGLQVEGKGEVKRVATGVTASLATIEKAVEWGADALVVHHGLFWEGDRQRLVGPMRTKVALLVEHGISLFGYHLPMDASPDVGNNFNAAQDLGLINLTSFAEFGVQGEIVPTPIEKWVEKVEGYYSHPAHAALGGPSMVKRVAIISGGAYKMLGEAADLGMDCMITGNFDEPAWHVAHERGIHFLALGHTNTEQVGPKALATYIKERHRVATAFLEVLNPF